MKRYVTIGAGIIRYMKISILCGTAQAGDGKHLGALLSDEGIEPRIIQVGPSWRSQAETWLQESTCFLLVPGLFAEDEPPAWMDFITGYCLGKGIVLVVYGNNRLPRNYMHIQQTENDAEFITIWRKHYQKWQSAEYIRKAVEALVAAGHGRRGEDFFRTVMDGDLRVVNLFIQAGLSPNSRDSRGVPVLSLAVRKRHGAIVKLLIACGADIDAVSEDRGNTALMDAAAEGLDSIVLNLVQAGAKVDIQSKNGQSALVLAVGQKHFKAATILVEAGADIQLKDSLGMTARDYARLFKEEDLLNFMDSCCRGTGNEN